MHITREVCNTVKFREHHSISLQDLERCVATAHQRSSTQTHVGFLGDGNRVLGKAAFLILGYTLKEDGVLEAHLQLLHGLRQGEFIVANLDAIAFSAEWTLSREWTCAGTADKDAIGNAETHKHEQKQQALLTLRTVHAQLEQPAKTTAP